MNSRIEHTTLEVEVFPEDGKGSSDFLDEELTPVQAIDESLRELKYYESRVSIMAVDKLRAQINQLAKQISSLKDEVPEGEPSTDWEREKIRLFNLARAKKNIASRFLNIATESDF